MTSCGRFIVWSSAMVAVLAYWWVVSAVVTFVSASEPGVRHEVSRGLQCRFAIVVLYVMFNNGFRIWE